MQISHLPLKCTDIIFIGEFHGFKNITFNNVNFTNATFNHVTFEDCSFQDCTTNMICHNVNMIACKFTNCNMNISCFKGKLTNVTFRDSTLLNSIFEKCTIHDGYWTNCDMKQISFKSSIGHRSHFKSCQMTKSDLYCSCFFDLSLENITSPPSREYHVLCKTSIEKGRL